MAAKLKILLLGEYSNYFNNLAFGLRKLGHNVVLANNGDLYKNYDRQIDISGFSDNLYINTFTRIINENLKVRQMKGFDIVQIINPNVFAAVANNLQLYKKIFRNNGNIFLSAVGDDYFWWKAYRDGKFKKSPHSGFLRDRKKDKAHWETHMGLRDANVFLAENAKAIIPGSISYAIPYKQFENCAPIILQPIPLEGIEHNTLDHTKEERLNVYHGAQLGRYGFKGTDRIDIAFENLSKHERDDLNLIRTDSIPFKEYLKMLASSHILIDQTNFIEPTMNALTTMLMGKVVLGGCEPIFMDYHRLREPPLININDDPASIVNAVLDLANDRSKMNTISDTAREYVIKNHDAVLIAKKFINCWDNYS
ncbi:hypothetical protein BST97_11240 [Nonlabens spongiae]|uniref:Glycosyltransferase n=1 Tax=Nonlabens spongiae TaxID=331648 RepID=A0A1W6MLM1_9FLAO|nr:hypothetical protein [Nonlabens spongiae]ARN78514.1 hypothetical protein BST97_11240 [Nonlabens spongiae]